MPGIAAVSPAPQPNTQIIAKALANRKGGILKFSILQTREEDCESRRTAFHGLKTAFFFQKAIQIF